MTFKCKFYFLEEEKRKVDKRWKINEQSGAKPPRERDCVHSASDLIIFGSLPVIACSKKDRMRRKLSMQKVFTVLGKV